LVKERSVSGQGFLDGGDTPAFRGVYEAAAVVVGATLNATSAIMKGQCRRAFVPIAGLHHAGRDHAAGFCVFNDCGVAIELLRRNSGLERIAYVDIDAHHGDGVFYAFEDDPGVIFADMHEDGRYLYPGTGASTETGKGPAEGTKLNLPMAPGSDDEAFAAVWPRVMAHVEKFAPEFIILQCGADSLEGDPITHLRYSASSHGKAARDLADLADRLGHGRVLGLGGGGYNRLNLAQAWTAVVEGLL
jgi:acetoin utilization protein AcuC